MDLYNDCYYYTSNELEFWPLSSNGTCFCFNALKPMAEAGNSMLYSLLLFVVTLSLQEMYRGKLASSELFTILGGFTSSLVFLFLLTVSSLLPCDDIHRLVCVFYIYFSIFADPWTFLCFFSSVIAMMHGNVSWSSSLMGLTVCSSILEIVIWFFIIVWLKL